MKNEKFGSFICQLRKEKSMSQQELADLIPIGREAISKWERGKTIPDYDSMIKLSEIFNLSINELLLGEKKNDTNIKYIETLSLNLYNDNKIKNRKIKFLSIFLIMVIFLLLVYYFVVNYNSIMIYDLHFNNENINITNGMVIKTNDKIYFNLGKITSINEIENLNLYYKDKNNNDVFIISTNNLNIYFADSLGYEEFFDFKNIDYIINNLYLDITYKNGFDSIKISNNKIYTNNTFFIKKVNNIG